jgi:hypothetical protein
MSVPYSSGDWRGIARDAESSALFGNDLDAWLAAEQGEIVVQYASREVRRIELAGNRVVYCKIIRALTDAGYRGDEWFSWCKWVLRPSRAIAAFRISEAVLAAGLECAVPLLAVRRRVKGIPSDIFVTAEVPFDDLWKDTALSGDELIHLLSSQTAKMHQCGFAHGDYILRNVCHNPQSGQLVLLDNDRTWRPPTFLRKHYFARNLAQMAYSLLKRYNGETAVAEQFLSEYAALRNFPSADAQHDIMTKCVARFNRKKK